MKRYWAIVFILFFGIVISAWACGKKAPPSIPRNEHSLTVAATGVDEK